MKIKFYLLENLLTPDPDDCRAVVAESETVTEKEIIELMTRAGSGITPAEAKANYEELIAAHEYFLKQGYGINTEFINVRPVIQGVFRNEDDKFDPSRHKIKFVATLGKRYNHTSSEVKVEKIEAVNNAPLPNKFEDVASGTFNQIATPGGTAILTGVRLKFDQNDPQQGLFFVDRNQQEFRVEQVLSLSSSKVIFMIPHLPSELYALEVRMVPHKTKAAKKGSLPDKLMV